MLGPYLFIYTVLGLQLPGSFRQCSTSWCLYSRLIGRGAVWCFRSYVSMHSLYRCTRVACRCSLMLCDADGETGVYSLGLPFVSFVQGSLSPESPMKSANGCQRSSNRVVRGSPRGKNSQFPGAIGVMFCHRVPGPRNPAAANIKIGLILLANCRLGDAECGHQQKGTSPKIEVREAAHALSSKRCLWARRRGEYLGGFEIKSKWFSRRARRAIIITSSNHYYLFNLDITRGA